MKRVKTELSEVQLHRDMFKNVYKDMQQKNPSLSVACYFIACLHSTKETDMELVNTVDGDVDFVFPN